MWDDEDGNGVDYDFVLELNGTDTELGIPVAFFECFWRRGSRHSKDKARDDSGKLLPMRSVHPTARFLGIIGAGDFTNPARALIRSREIDLFYVPKAKLIAAFDSLGMQVDYPDTLDEPGKRRLVKRFQSEFTLGRKTEAAARLSELLGDASINTYVDRVRGALGALPQEIRFIARRDSTPRVFETIPEATAFLDRPDYNFSGATETYVYQITYTDGSEFESVADSLERLRSLHKELEALASHVSKLGKE